MGLVNAESVVNAVEGYRLLWIAGRVGGHKTSLAYMIAKKYLEKGYKLITNNKSIWADDISKIELDENGKLNAVVILDEGGLYFSTAAQVKEIAAYLAKMNMIVIVPSFWAPSAAAQVITIQPLWNLKSAGIPVVVYRWQVKIQSFKDSGHFIWWSPNEIYGIYSRQDPGADPENITEFLRKKATEYRKHHGYDDGVSKMANTEQDLLLEAVEQFSQAVGSLEALPKRKHFR